MSRKEFKKEVSELILIKCRRHCAVCDRWCGPNIEIHHIESHEDNSEDNAIPVCFDCHAMIGHYNSQHPKGKKYTPTELRELRDICFKKYDDTLPDLPKGQTEYGRGFHDGAVWTERMMTQKDIWRFISAHGDYAIENLLYFETDDTHTIMDETFYADFVKTPYGTQFENHISAWAAGVIAGLWDQDGNRELLFITEKGKIFKEIVLSNPSLRKRYELLKDFWSKVEYGKEIKKPSDYWDFRDKGFSPGVLNWFQTEMYKLIRIDGDTSKLYLIYDVTPEKLELKDIEQGECIVLEEDSIRDADLDHRKGELILYLRKE